MEPVITDDVATRFLRFATHETPDLSDTYTAWATGLAHDAETVALIASLPPRQRQPNLVFAVARAVSPDLVDPLQTVARDDEYQRFRAVVHERWSDIVSLTATHHTQTNEAARVAVLLPALHTIHRSCGKPLALVELGASAGLLLHPHAWSYRYLNRAGQTVSQFSPTGPPAGPPVGELTVTLENPSLEAPSALPPIDWRLGVDLNPLDVRRPEVVQWLRTLIWPGQTARMARLDAAIAAAVADPVVLLARDITGPNTLDEVLAMIPTDRHPVVFHCAVQAYLEADDRARLSADLLSRARAGQLSWLSYEGAGVVDVVSSQIEPPMRARITPGDFVVAVDGRPHYLADGHAHWIG